MSTTVISIDTGRVRPFADQRRRWRLRRREHNSRMQIITYYGEQIAIEHDDGSFEITSDITREELIRNWIRAERALQEAQQKHIRDVRILTGRVPPPPDHDHGIKSPF